MADTGTWGNTCSTRPAAFDHAFRALLLPPMQRVREELGVGEFVIVGDRGILSHNKAIDELREHDGIGWSTALSRRYRSAQLPDAAQ